MTSKEAKPWIFSLGRGAQAPRSLVCCVRHWQGFPASCPGQIEQNIEMSQGRAQLCPGTACLALQPSPCRAAGMGQGGRFIQETPSRSAICWVPAVLPSHRCWEALGSFSSQQLLLSSHASAKGCEGACAKEELAGFKQPDSH